MSEQPTPQRAAQAANLFDLRRIIGRRVHRLRLLLTILGLFDSQEEIDKAAGVNINLWAASGCSSSALLMIAWALTRPLGSTSSVEAVPHGASAARRDAATLLTPARHPARDDGAPRAGDPGPVAPAPRRRSRRRPSGRPPRRRP
jgi:hypothetical protein